MNRKQKKKWRKRAKFDVEGPLVSYGESIGSPLQWGAFQTREGAANNDGSFQQCDDEEYLSLRWRDVSGLGHNTEGEAIGGFQ